MSFSNVSGDFNGISSDFVVELMSTAVEQPSPDHLPDVHDVYDSTFIGSECTAQPGQRLRNMQMLLFQAPGGLATGQSFDIGSGDGALVYYGEEGTGGDRTWSGSSGTVLVDFIDGSTVTLRVVAADMSPSAGAATGSFRLHVSGAVYNFTRQ